jgi:sulfide:quinone oxidoreductase
MKITQVNEQLSFSDQITLDEIETLAKQGVKALICNRPDGEEAGQLTAEQIETEASKHGIKFLNIPVPGRVIPNDSLDKFSKALTSTNEKIHAYCRTGTRCSIFWGLTQAQNQSVEQTLEQAKTLGIDLSPVIDQLQAVNSAAE